MSAQAQGNKTGAASWGKRLMIAGVVIALIGLILALSAEFFASTMIGVMVVFYYSLFIGGGLGLLFVLAGLILKFMGRN